MQISNKQLIDYLKIKAFDSIRFTLKNSRSEAALNQIYGITYFIEDIINDLDKKDLNKETETKLMDVEVGAHYKYDARTGFCKLEIE